MKKEVFAIESKRLLLITNDVFLRRGVRESLRPGNNISFTKLERLNNIKASEVDVVLLDLLSWQTSEIYKGKSILDYLSNVDSTVIMVACNDFQEIITDILYQELPKARRRDIIPLINMLCGRASTFKFKPLPGKKVFLTKREFQVINEFIIGCGVRNIEDKLSINHKTVCSHKLSALRKIGCKNLSHLFILILPFIFDLKLLLKKRRLNSY